MPRIDPKTNKVTTTIELKTPAEGGSLATGEGAVVKAMKEAIDSKLLEENSIKGARGALINFTGPANMPLSQIEDALSLINEEADDDATTGRSFRWCWC